MRINIVAATALAACSRLAAAAMDTIVTDATPQASSASAADSGIAPTMLYPAHNFSLPVDHFHNESMYNPHSNDKFNNRYWFDDTFYKPGGPVFLLLPGEINGDYRLPIMQKGIIYQFIKAFGGMGVVLEHRYFGRSQPQADLSTKSYRFCTTDQALADTDYFARNIVFPGHEHENLTATARPWITYGGSYAGAFVAFLRTQYPGTFWGSISSSGVTEAIYDYWNYFEPIRMFGPPQCIQNIQKLTNMVDNILMGNQNRRRDVDGKPKTDRALIGDLKKAFGLGGLPRDNDFANVISVTDSWQSLNWDPALNSTRFGDYCSNLTATKPYYANEDKKQQAQKFLAAGGYGKEAAQLTVPLLNYFGFINDTVAGSCGKDSQESCLSNYNQAYYTKTDYDQWTYKSWPYMWCTQWGFLQTGSGAPKNILPLKSRLVDLPFSTEICRAAFGINKAPDTQAINSRGGFDIAYPRLAIIGGKRDPWKEATPFADSANWRGRKNSTDMPLFLIDDGVHHWDENGLFPKEVTPSTPPPDVRQVQDYMRSFVKAWLHDAKSRFPDYREMEL